MSRRASLRKVVGSPVDQAVGVVGAILLVDGVEKKNSMPVEAAGMERMLAATQALAAFYESGGLPPKLFYFAFQQAQLLVLFTKRSQLIVWAGGAIRTTELEIAAKKIVSTAHLKGELPSGNAIAATWADQPAAPAVPPPSLELHSAQTSTMTWQSASEMLESTLAKVLSQAQAAKLIKLALQQRGLSPDTLADAKTFEEIGLQLTQKIPSKPIRASLEKEIAGLVAQIAS